MLVRPTLEARIKATKTCQLEPRNPWLRVPGRGSSKANDLWQRARAEPMLIMPKSQNTWMSRIPEFESYMPSQPVRSLDGMSCS
jgi:hypothetical protein